MTFTLGIWFICIRLAFLSASILFKEIAEWVIPNVITGLLFYLGICFVVFPFILMLPIIFSIPLGLTLSLIIVIFLIDDIQDWRKKTKKETE